MSGSGTKVKSGKNDNSMPTLQMGKQERNAMKKKKVNIPSDLRPKIQQKLEDLYGKDKYITTCMHNAENGRIKHVRQVMIDSQVPVSMIGEEREAETTIASVLLNYLKKLGRIFKSGWKKLTWENFVKGPQACLLDQVLSLLKRFKDATVKTIQTLARELYAALDEFSQYILTAMNPPDFDPKKGDSDSIHYSEGIPDMDTNYDSPNACNLAENESSAFNRVLGEIMNGLGYFISGTAKIIGSGLLKIVKTLVRFLIDLVDGILALVKLGLGHVGNFFGGIFNYILTTDTPGLSRMRNIVIRSILTVTSCTDLIFKHQDLFLEKAQDVLKLITKKIATVFNVLVGYMEDLKDSYFGKLGRSFVNSLLNTTAWIKFSHVIKKSWGFFLGFCAGINRWVFGTVSCVRNSLISFTSSLISSVMETFAKFLSPKIFPSMHILGLPVKNARRGSDFSPLAEQRNSVTKCVTKLLGQIPPSMLENNEELRNYVSKCSKSLKKSKQHEKDYFNHLEELSSKDTLETVKTDIGICQQGAEYYTTLLTSKGPISSNPERDLDKERALASTFYGNEQIERLFSLQDDTSEIANNFVDLIASIIGRQEFDDIMETSFGVKPRYRSSLIPSSTVDKPQKINTAHTDSPMVEEIDSPVLRKIPLRTNDDNVIVTEVDDDDDDDDNNDDDNGDDGDHGDDSNSSKTNKSTRKSSNDSKTMVTYGGASSSSSLLTKRTRGNEGALDIPWEKRFEQGGLEQVSEMLSLRLGGKPVSMDMRDAFDARAALTYYVVEQKMTYQQAMTEFGIEFADQDLARIKEKSRYQALTQRIILSIGVLFVLYQVYQLFQHEEKRSTAVNQEFQKIYGMTSLGDKKLIDPRKADAITDLLRYYDKERSVDPNEKPFYESGDTGNLRSRMTSSLEVLLDKIDQYVGKKINENQNRREQIAKENEEYNNSYAGWATWVGSLVIKNPSFNPLPTDPDKVNVNNININDFDLLENADLRKLNELVRVKILSLFGSTDGTSDTVDGYKIKSALRAEMVTDLNKLFDDRIVKPIQKATAEVGKAVQDVIWGSLIDWFPFLGKITILSLVTTALNITIAFTAIAAALQCIPDLIAALLCTMSETPRAWQAIPTDLSRGHTGKSAAATIYARHYAEQDSEITKLLKTWATAVLNTLIFVLQYSKEISAIFGPIIGEALKAGSTAIVALANMISIISTSSASIWGQSMLPICVLFVVGGVLIWYFTAEVLSYIKNWVTPSSWFGPLWSTSSSFIESQLISSDMKQLKINGTPTVKIISCMICSSPHDYSVSLSCPYCFRNRYCSQSCFSKDWNLGHKLQCKAKRSHHNCSSKPLVARCQ